MRLNQFFRSFVVYLVVCSIAFSTTNFLPVAYAAPTDSAASQIENATLGTRTSSFLVGAYVDVFNGSEKALYKIDLNRRGQSIHPQFTPPLRIRIDENRNLIFEAWIGSDSTGQGGSLISRMHLPSLPKVLTYTLDKNLLSIITVTGEVWTTDLAVNTHLYPNPPLFFQTGNLAHLNLNFSNLDVQAKFLTPGSEPFSMNDLAAGAVLPEIEGKTTLHAGDLMITATINNQKKVLSVQPRDLMHDLMKKQFNYHALRAMMLQNDPEMIEKVRKVLERVREDQDELETMMAKIEADEQSNPAIAASLKALPQDYIDTLLSRASWHQTSAESARDRFTLAEWPERFNKLVKTAEVQNPNATPEYLKAITESGWQDLVKPATERAKSAEDRYEIPKENYIKTYKWLAGITLLTAAIGAISFDPTIVKHVAAIDWIYEHLVMDVLKHPQYVWYNVGSIISQSLLIPIVVGLSVYSGNLISKVGAMAEKWDSKTGIIIRDFAKTWGAKAMNPWQRIVTFGNRLFGKAQSAHIRLIEDVLRQKNLFPVVTAGMNPFRRVEIRTRDNQVKKQFLGFTNPFQKKDDITLEAVQKNYHFAEALSEKDQLRSQAYLLAAVAVAEEYKIDLSTLLMMSENQSPTYNDLKALLEDPKKSQEFLLTTEAIHRELLRLPSEVRKDLAHKMPAEIKKQYDFDVKIAKKIVSLDPTRKFLKQLRIRSSRFTIETFQGLLNLGRQSYDVLNTKTASRYASFNTAEGYIADTNMSILFPAFFGARADLSRPADLAASSNFWTGYISNPHLSDQGMNTIIHLIIAASNSAILFEKNSLGVLEEQYKPMEDIAVESKDTHDGYLKSLWDWIKVSVNPLRGDIGGYALRKQMNSISILQGNFLFSMTTRLVLGAQNLHDAFFGFWLFWLAGNITFGWPWMPVQAGYKAYAEEFNVRNGQLTEARRNLLYSKRDVSPQEAAKLVEEGMQELRDLYQQHKPELLGELDSLIKTRDIDALVKMTLEKPPFNKAPSPKLMTSLMYVVGIITTALAIELMTQTYNPAYLNMATIGSWVGYSFLFTGGLWLTMSRASWQRFDIANRIKRIFGKGDKCETALTDSKSNNDQKKDK